MFDIFIVFLYNDTNTTGGVNMNRDFIKLMTDEDLLEGMRIRLQTEGFREKTVMDLLSGAGKIIEKCPRSQLCDAVFAPNPEKEIRPLLDKLFPYMPFNKIGWYSVAFRILGDCMRKIASNELNENDIKRLNELKRNNIEYEGAPSAEENKQRDVFPNVSCHSEQPKKNTIAAKKSARKLTLPFPRHEDAVQLLRSMQEDEELRKQDACIRQCMEEAGYKNTDPEAVLKKVNLILSLGGPTRVNRSGIASQIVACHVDEYIENGSPEAVIMLAGALHDENQKSFYLFAVKYCAAHYPEKFPHYNTAAVRALKYCRDHHDFYPFSGEELLDYEKYKKLLNIFRRKYALENLSLSEISCVLTAAGKLLVGK